MGRNTFDVEQVFKQLDKEWEQARRKPAPAKISGDYEIEATGLDGWMSYRYQYKVGAGDFFGYAETIEEARANILKAQAEGVK
jgi:AAA+ ATPase superfamily predicted ATPase